MFTWTKGALDWFQSWATSPTTDRTAERGAALHPGGFPEHFDGEDGGLLRTLVIRDREIILWSPPIATGGYATIHAASERCDDKNSRYTAPYVVKATHFGTSADIRRLAENERAIYEYLESCRCHDRPQLPNGVVRFYGSCVLEGTESSVFLLLERVRGGSLAELFEREALARQPLPESLLLRIALDLLGALRYLHALRPAAIIHRDVKLENILYDPQAQRWLLCDLASAQLFVPEGDHRTSPGESALASHPVATANVPHDPNSSTVAMTTRWYRAPEMIDAFASASLVHSMPEKQDIWACGCVLFSLAYGFHPFANDGELQIISGAPWHLIDSKRRAQYSDRVEQLLRGLLKLDVQRRWSANDAIAFLLQESEQDEHPFSLRDAQLNVHDASLNSDALQAHGSACSAPMDDELCWATFPEVDTSRHFEFSGKTCSGRQREVHGGSASVKRSFAGAPHSLNSIASEYPGSQRVNADYTQLAVAESMARKGTSHAALNPSERSDITSEPVSGIATRQHVYGIAGKEPPQTATIASTTTTKHSNQSNGTSERDLIDWH